MGSFCSGVNEITLFDEDFVRLLKKAGTFCLMFDSLSTWGCILLFELADGGFSNKFTELVQHKFGNEFGVSSREMLGDKNDEFFNLSENDNSETLRLNGGVEFINSNSLLTSFSSSKESLTFGSWNLSLVE